MGKTDFTVIKGIYTTGDFHTAATNNTALQFTSQENVLALHIHDARTRENTDHLDFTGSLTSATKKHYGKKVNLMDTFVGKVVKGTFDCKKGQGTISIVPTTRFKKIIGIKPDIGKEPKKKKKASCA